MIIKQFHGYFPTISHTEPESVACQSSTCSNEGLSTPSGTHRYQMYLQ